MRWTEVTLTPAASAIAAPVQCIASPDGASIVSVTTLAAIRGSSFGMREGRVLSCRSPSTPSAAKRSCQRQTQVLDLPVSRNDRVRTGPLGAEQNDLRSPDVLLRRVSVFDHTAKPIKLGGRDGKRNAISHAANSHAASPPGIPVGIQMSDFIH